MLLIVIPTIYQTGLLILSQITWSFAAYRSCEDRGPVCGNDGKTYKNMCQLMRAKINDPDLQVLHDGGCYGESLSAPAYPDEDDAESRSPEKILEKQLKKLQSSSKLALIMPYGWPPMGPIFPQNSTISKPRSEFEEKLIR